MENLVIKSSFKYRIKMLSLFIGILIVLGYLIKSELDERKNPTPTRSLKDERRGRTALIIYAIFAPIVGLGLVLMIVDLSKEMPVATLTNEGIVLKYTGLIYWKDVDCLGIYEIENPKMVFIVIEVKDEKKVREELIRRHTSKIIKKISRYVAKNKISRRIAGCSPFHFNVSESTMSAEFVLAEMQKRLDTYRENVKEPNKLM